MTCKTCGGNCGQCGVSGGTGAPSMDRIIDTLHGCSEPAPEADPAFILRHIKAAAEDVMMWGDSRVAACGERIIKLVERLERKA